MSRCVICKKDFRGEGCTCNHLACIGKNEALRSMLKKVFSGVDALTPDEMQVGAGMKDGCTPKSRQRSRMNFRRVYLYPWIEAGMIERVYGMKRAEWKVKEPNGR